MGRALSTNRSGGKTGTCRVGRRRLDFEKPDFCLRLHLSIPHQVGQGEGRLGNQIFFLSCSDPLDLSSWGSEKRSKIRSVWTISSRSLSWMFIRLSSRNCIRGLKKTLIKD